MRHFIAAAALSAAGPASAAVVQSSETGFTTRHELVIAAPPAKVWAMLLQPGQWWQASHTYSGDAANLTLDPRAGGCWCEKTGDGSVEHLRVVYLAAPKMLRMTGALGPLQALPVTGVMTFTLAAEGAGTKLTVSYAVAGAGLGGFAAPVDGVLGTQWPRLKAAAER